MSPDLNLSEVRLKRNRVIMASRNDLPYFNRPPYVPARFPPPAPQRAIVPRERRRRPPQLVQRRPPRPLHLVPPRVVGPHLRSSRDPHAGSRLRQGGQVSDRPTEADLRSGERGQRHPRGPRQDHAQPARHDPSSAALPAAEARKLFSDIVHFASMEFVN